jgi:hypothetical protein
MKKIFVIALALLPGCLTAQDFVSDEDRSRFVERPYRAAETGMLPPSSYIQLAKDAIHKMSDEIHFRIFSNGIVSHRFYRNAAPADRDMICVAFIYEGDLSGGGLIGNGWIFSRANYPIPVVQALIRKDRSKIYVNVIHYKSG